MHHIALLVRDVESVAQFYRDALDGREVMQHFNDEGQVRSIWLLIGNVVLMVERSIAKLELDHYEPYPAEEAKARQVAQSRLGWSVVAFSARGQPLEAWEEKLQRFGVPVAYRTDWTLYFQDPEMNTVAVSNYPVPVAVEAEVMRAIP